MRPESVGRIKLSAVSKKSKQNQIKSKLQEKSDVSQKTNIPENYQKVLTVNQSLTDNIQRHDFCTEIQQKRKRKTHSVCNELSESSTANIQDNCYLASTVNGINHSAIKITKSDYSEMGMSENHSPGMDVGQSYPLVKNIGESSPGMDNGESYSPDKNINNHYSPGMRIVETYSPDMNIGESYSSDMNNGESCSPDKNIGNHHSPGMSIVESYSPDMNIGKTYSPYVITGEMYSPGMNIGESYSPDIQINNCNNSVTIELVPPSLELGLTYEEEFRIYELLVRKENLLDGMFEISLQIPNFLETWKDFLIAQPSMTKEYRNILEKKHESVLSNFFSYGSVRRSLDMFDEFKNVDEKVKIETMGNASMVLHIFNR